MIKFTASNTVFIILLLLCCCVGNLKAQHDDPLHRPFNREILDHYERKSQEYVARNLNRFSLDRLQAYDRLLDSLYLREKSDKLAEIEMNYQ
jgi:hypothetical protein